MVKPRVEMDVVDTWFRRISSRIVLGICFMVQDAQFEKSAVRTTATVVSVRQEVRKHTDNHRSNGGVIIHVGGNHVSPTEPAAMRLCDSGPGLGMIFTFIGAFGSIIGAGVLAGGTHDEKVLN